MVPTAVTLSKHRDFVASGQQLHRDVAIETRDRSQALMGLDARFRGHDAAESSNFMRKLPGLIPERRAGVALRACLPEIMRKRLLFPQRIHSPRMPIAAVCELSRANLNS
jgi:hypothetical protein